MTDSHQQERSERPNSTWSPAARFWVSAVLAFHLFCVILAPLATVEPRSGLAVDLQGLVYPYTRLLYLQHGYRFFAPEPGPSHVVRFEVTRPSGELISGHFPDREHTWPRLLYHRWFMLSETVFMHVSETLDPQELDAWQKQIREQIAALVDSDPRAAEGLEFQLRRELQEHERVARLRDRLVTDLGKFLLRRYDGVTVRMKMVTRVIPDPEDVRRGLKLDDERYLPAELQYDLGTVHRDSDTLEIIIPQEPDPTASSEGQP